MSAISRILNNSFWSWVGKAFAGIALLLSIWQGVTALLNSEYEVEAQGDVFYYDESPQTASELSWHRSRVQFFEQGENDTSERPVQLSAGPPELVSQPGAFDDAVGQIRKRMVEEEVNRLWDFRLTNTGTNYLEGLSLKIPVEGLYSLFIEDEKVGEGFFEHDLEIGTLKATEQARVLVWERSLMNDNAWESVVVRGEPFLALHRNGSQEIEFPTKARGFWAWIMSIPWILIAAVLVFAFTGWFTETRRQSPVPDNSARK